MSYPDSLETGTNKIPEKSNFEDLWKNAILTIMNRLFLLLLPIIATPIYSNSHYDLKGASGKNENRAKNSVFFISPSGNDSKGHGTLKDPWFTLTKAWENISPGDTIFMMGGTYRYSETTYLGKKSGTSESHITICNYRDEHPVINYDHIVFTEGCVGLKLENVSYLDIRGIRICYINQPSAGTIAQYGVLLWSNVSNCKFEQVECDHIGGWGFTIGDFCYDDLFLNCDSHHNADPYSSDKYGWSDGFETGSVSSDRITFEGCRAWWNSDDGWDLRRANGHYTIKNCWSFCNGFVPGTFVKAGNGTAFKLGGKSAPATRDTLRFVYGSLAYRCSSGFDPQPDSPDLTFSTVFLNCTAYMIEGRGFSVQWYKEEDILKNCIQYKCGGGVWVPNGTYTRHNNNSWDSDVKVTDSDFLSLDPAGLYNIRKPDGGLPEIDFLHLAPGSDLVDAGAIAGLPYKGKNPDLGAFESRYSSSGRSTIRQWLIILRMLFII